jgi:hypothetical protein
MMMQRSFCMGGEFHEGDHDLFTEENPGVDALCQFSGNTCVIIVEMEKPVVGH